MLKFKLISCILFLLALSPIRCFPQTCHELLETLTDNTGATRYSFRNQIDIMAENDTEGLAINGYTSNNTVVIIFKVIGGGQCVDHDSPIHVEFKGNTKLKLKNAYESNCEQKSVLYLQVKSDILDAFETNHIASVKIMTNTERFTKVNFSYENAITLVQHIRCLANHLSEAPSPPDRMLRDSTTVFAIAEHQPEFDGGYEAMLKFMEQNIKFPQAARHGINGTVIVTFIVGRDGLIYEIKVPRGVHPDLDAEAIRVVKLMPPWIPGRQDGKPVNARFTLPIKFNSN